MTRWQLTFSRGEALKYVGHLDLSRAWLRAMRRADIPLAYSAGFHPHAKLAFASPLPVGILGAAELLDVAIARDLPADVLLDRIQAQLPNGLSLLAIEPLSGPPLASRIRYAEYRALINDAVAAGGIAARVATLLASESLPRIRQREHMAKAYDLRPLIAYIDVQSPVNVGTVDRGAPARHDEGMVVGATLPVAPTGATILQDRGSVVRMRLVVDNQGAGRPDEVLDALGLLEHATSIERAALILNA